MSKRDEFVTVAQSQVGVREQSKNNVKYNDWYYGKHVEGDGYPWCAVFVSWCANQVGILNNLIPKEAYVPYEVDWYEARGLYHTSNYTPKKGDLAIFSRQAHIGIVEYYDGRTHTIEGNKEDMVKRCDYNTWGSIIGYCEVQFGDSPEPTPTHKIAEDGYWGKDTTRKAQEVFGTPVDGIVSNQYLYYKNLNPGLLSSTFDWKQNPRGGSNLIAAIQRKVGTSVDGFIGTNTIKAMQNWLGTPRDGKVSAPSTMVRSFQRWLNQQ